MVQTESLSYSERDESPGVNKQTLSASQCCNPFIPFIRAGIRSTYKTAYFDAPLEPTRPYPSGTPTPIPRKNDGAQVVIVSQRAVAAGFHLAQHTFDKLASSGRIGRKSSNFSGRINHKLAELRAWMATKKRDRTDNATDCQSGGGVQERKNPREFETELEDVNRQRD